MEAQQDLFEPQKDGSYIHSKNFFLSTVSYLPGCDLFHKIALTSSEIRKILSKSGLLDQIRVITFKPPQSNYYPHAFPIDSLRYALDLADSIQIQVDVYHLEYAKFMFDILKLVRVSSNKELKLDVILLLRHCCFCDAYKSLQDLKLPIRKTHKFAS
jgi:hypothetical protein